MKVLLFVQTGDGRPKCAGMVGPNDCVVEGGRLVRLCLTDGQNAKRSAADRWWLVECENAEEGRGHIALFVEATRRLRPGMGFGHARILASGGKA